MKRQLLVGIHKNGIHTSVWDIYKCMRSIRMYRIHTNETDTFNACFIKFLFHLFITIGYKLMNDG